MSDYRAVVAGASGAVGSAVIGRCLLLRDVRNHLLWSAESDMFDSLPNSGKIQQVVVNLDEIEKEILPPTRLRWAAS